MIKFKHRGNFDKTERFFNYINGKNYLNALDEWGQYGVDALAAYTPKDTGLTASSWTYEIEQTKDHTSIHWLNTNVNNGVNIAIILQYGHGTGTGGYVQGRDYINPAIQPAFDIISEAVWKSIQTH